ncbi:hypothetical protein [Pantoea sp. MBLJ3]|uniref:hypothetical protein n=1 Tax=Pantoea sp. MBLJ3 TaxID=1562889 RepID=UPI00057D27D4|nr:hypothetical protein [Pantoea sp. MBLJ3]
MATSAAGAKRDLEKWRLKETDSFSKRVTKASKLASVELQRDINRKIDRPTKFTQNAVGFNFKIDKFGTKNRIYIKDIQSNYLSKLIDDNQNFGKFVPVPGKVNQFGNIPNLKTRRGLEPVTQNHNGHKRTILIKKSAKTANKIVAIYKPDQHRSKALGSWAEICNQLEKTVARVSAYK